MTNHKPFPSLAEIDRRVSSLERDNSYLRIACSVNRQLIQVLCHFNAQGIFWSTVGVNSSSVLRTPKGSPLGSPSVSVLDFPSTAFHVPSAQSICENVIRTSRVGI